MGKLSGRAGFLARIGLVSVCAVLAACFLSGRGNLLPFRWYHVLTDSMEPEIGTNSLVLVKTYREGMPVKKGDIITFRADRFGEEIVITHWFSHTEINEAGQTVYRTHPEGSDVPDAYETTSEDILGVYLFHIPYAGKIALFLKSPFGWLWLCQMTLIFLARAQIAARWEEAEACAL